MPIASFVAPGAAHTIVMSDDFYDLEAEGVRLVDFLVKLVAGEVAAELRCTVCR